MPKEEPMIRVQDVKFRYDPEQPTYAVDGVSLNVRRGEFVAVLGANGCGKSTLAKHFNAILLPETGTVLVENMDTRGEDHLYDIRQKVGMVFQNPDNQIVANVVREDVAFGLENLGVPQDEMVRRVEASLSAVRMSEFAETAPHMLSGGQKQRVAIAGALAMEPELIIMDEATAMLDPSGRAEVLATVRKLNREKGMTVVWITHFMEEAAQADRLIVMNDGSVALEGTPRQVFSRVEEIKALGLDVPPMAELAQTLRDKGLPLPEGILTVSDMVKELKDVLCPSK